MNLPNYRSGNPHDSQLVQHARMLRSADSAGVNRRGRCARECCDGSATTRLDFRTQNSAVRICRSHAGFVGCFGLSQPQRALSCRSGAGQVLCSTAALVSADFLCVRRVIRHRLLLRVSAVPDQLTPMVPPNVKADMSGDWSFPSPRCASAIQIVRPLESIA